jgi:hypothetical protein
MRVADAIAVRAREVRERLRPPPDVQRRLHCSGEIGPLVGGEAPRRPQRLENSPTGPAPPGSGKTALIATVLSQRPSRVAYHVFSGVWYGSDGLEESFSCRTSWSSLCGYRAVTTRSPNRS